MLIMISSYSIKAQWSWRLRKLSGLTINLCYVLPLLLYVAGVVLIFFLNLSNRIYDEDALISTVQKA